MSTTNMGLPIPAFQSTTYPSEIATAFQLIDDHDHTAGKGAPILGSGTVTTLTGLAFVPVVGQQIYFKESTLTWELGRADADATLSIATIIKVISTSSALATHSGSIPTIAHGFTVGKIYYQSPTVIGGVTDVEPTDPEHYSRPCFQAIDATTLFVLNSLRPIKVSDGALATVTTSVGAGDAGKVPKLDVNGAFDASFFNQKPMITFNKTVNQTIPVNTGTTVTFETKTPLRGFDTYFTSALSGTHLTALKACTILINSFGTLETTSAGAGNNIVDWSIEKNGLVGSFSSRTYYSPATAPNLALGMSYAGVIDLAIGDTLVCKGAFSGASGTCSIRNGSFAKVYIL